MACCFHAQILFRFYFLRKSYLFFILFSLTIFAQKTKNNQQFLIWQQRVESLTDGILKDSSSLPDSEQSIYLALLAKTWWKIDPQKANMYIKKAAKMAISSLESESESELTIRIKNAQKTIQIIGGLDESLSQKLLEQFINVTTEKAKTSEQNGDTLVLIALQVVEKNPQLAFETGNKSLGFGNPMQIVGLIGELNVKDSKLAERLYLAALYNAKNNYNLRFISRLSVKAFSEYKGKPLSDSARRSFLTFLAEMLSRSFTRFC